MTNRTKMAVALAYCAAWTLPVAGRAGGQEMRSTSRPQPAAGAIAGAASRSHSRCAAPEYRQLDFWLGEWDVVTPSGEPAGSDRVTSVLDGCVIQEEWIDVEGRRGMSVTNYALAGKQWFQTYVDDQGTLLRVSGTLTDDGKLVLLGAGALPGGGNVTHRIVYERAPDRSGSFRQRWETSADDGRTWNTLFEGIYRRKR